MGPQLTGWRKSSHSHFEENACVEIGFARDAIGVRDTKQAAMTARPVLVCSEPAFAAFLAHVTGER